MSKGDILLIEDETIVRLFPPLRFAWAMKGNQAQVRITGCNAKRVLFGAINPRTGHRVVWRVSSTPKILQISHLIFPTPEAQSRRGLWKTIS